MKQHTKIQLGIIFFIILIINSLSVFSAFIQLNGTDGKNFTINDQWYNISECANYGTCYDTFPTTTFNNSLWVNVTGSLTQTVNTSLKESDAGCVDGLETVRNFKTSGNNFTYIRTQMYTKGDTYCGVTNPWGYAGICLSKNNQNCEYGFQTFAQAACEKHALFSYTYDFILNGSQIWYWEGGTAKAPVDISTYNNVSLYVYASMPAPTGGTCFSDVRFYTTYTSFDQNGFDNKFHIYAINSTGGSISNFNATVNGTLYTTTTGNIQTNFTREPPYLVNITIDIPGYAYYSQINYNTSTDLTANISSLFSITCANEQTSATINTFNATINGTTYNGTIGSLTTTIDPSAGLFNITVRSVGYQDRTYTNYNVSTTLAAQLKPFFKVTAFDSISSVWIQNYTIDVGSYFFNVTNYNLTTNITYDSGLYNITFTSTGFPTTTYLNYNLSTNLLANISSYVYTLNYTYDNITYEMESQTLSHRINYTGLVYDANATLTYNGTVMNLTKTNGSDYFLFTTTFVNPYITLNNETKEFTWQTYLNTSKGIVNVNQSYNQTIFKIQVDNCSTYTTRALNFSILDDVSLIPIANVTFAGFFDVWVDNIANTRSFNLTWALSDTSNYGVCIAPGTSVFNTYLQVEYSAGSYSTKRYYFSNTTLDNNTNNINLYLTLNSTPVLLTVIDQNGNSVSGAYISVLKYNLLTNSAFTTEQVVTDSNGHSVSNGIVLNNMWYKFIVVYNGIAYLETSPEILLSNVRTPFVINLLPNFVSNFITSQNIQCNIAYNTGTHVFTLSYVDPSGLSTVGCLRVLNRTIYGDNTLYNNCTSLSSGGSLYSSAFAESNTSTLVGQGTFTDHTGNTFNCEDIVEIETNIGFSTWGFDGVFMSFLIILSLAMFGIWHPVIGMGTTILAFVFTDVFGFFHMGWQYLIVLIILGIIAMYRTGRK